MKLIKGLVGGGLLGIAAGLAAGMFLNSRQGKRVKDKAKRALRDLDRRVHEEYEE